MNIRIHFVYFFSRLTAGLYFVDYSPIEQAYFEVLPLNFNIRISWLDTVLSIGCSPQLLTNRVHSNYLSTSQVFSALSVTFSPVWNGPWNCPTLKSHRDLRIIFWLSWASPAVLFLHCFVLSLWSRHWQGTDQKGSRQWPRSACDSLCWWQI